MSDAGYPHGDALIPESFDEHTVVFLVRPPDAPTFTDEELDRLQVEHLTYLRELKRRGVLITNGPLTEQTDERYRGISMFLVPKPRGDDANPRTMAQRPPPVPRGVGLTPAGAIGDAPPAF